MPDPYAMNNYAFFLATDRKNAESGRCNKHAEANVTILNRTKLSRHSSLDSQPSRQK